MKDRAIEVLNKLQQIALADCSPGNPNYLLKSQMAQLALDIVRDMAGVPGPAPEVSQRTTATTPDVRR